jgi:hypothetical protein
MHRPGTAIVMATASLFCAVAHATTNSAPLPTSCPAFDGERKIAQADQEADICPPGMQPVDEEHCCWPGQRFVAERQTCKGKPVCPPGMSAAGASCVPTPVAPRPAPPPAAPAPLVYSTPPTSALPPPPAPAPPPAALPANPPARATLVPLPAPAPPGYPAPAPAGAPAGSCFPPCRTGFLCWNGQCVSACNPPCGPGQQCAQSGACVPAVAEPIPQPASPPEQYAQPPAQSLPPVEQYVPSPAQVAPPPSQIAGVPVRFAASDDGDYDVSVTGASSATCHAPCTLPLAPGSTKVTISGSMSLTTELVVPNEPSVVQISRGRPGVRTTGWVLFGVGTVGSAVLAATNQNASEMSTSELGQRLGLAVVSAALVVVGIGMVVATAQTVCMKPDADQRASSTRGSLRFAGIGAAPTHGGALLSTTLRF